MTGREVNGAQGEDIMTMKLAAADGAILWRVHDGGLAGLTDRGWSIVIGPDDHPVVTGTHSTAADPADYRTIKLDTADGSRLWGRTLPGAINYSEREAGWLAVCDDGDIIMANRTLEAATSFDVVLHRYAADDGASVWTTRYNSSGTIPDDPTCMIRDAAGDLLVAGVQAGDFMALKFDEASGDLLWSQDHDGPSGGYDAAAALLEGPVGEVIVTGFATGVGTSWDAATVAFDPTDGTPLWEENFDLGEGGADEGRALAVSPRGDLYVTGYCEITPADTDMIALRYLLAGPVSVINSPLATAAESLELRIFAHPNPFRRRLSLIVDVAHAVSARLAVYDVRGRRIVRLHEGGLSSGEHRIAWDGRDGTGEPLAAGIYFVELESAGARAVQKVVLRD